MTLCGAVSVILLRTQVGTLWTWGWELLRCGPSLGITGCRAASLTLPSDKPIPSTPIPVLKVKTSSDIAKQALVGEGRAGQSCWRTTEDESQASLSLSPTHSTYPERQPYRHSLRPMFLVLGCLRAFARAVTCTLECPLTFHVSLQT